MNTKPLLSICIPTYNREKQLKRLMDSIVSQKGFTDDIEIVISDGPSKDNTQNLVCEFQKKYKNIRYYRNENNIGMTAAFLEVIEYSNGIYSRLMGSDDQMNSYALEHIIIAIKKERPKLILSTLFHYSKETEIKNSIQKNEFNIFSGFEELASFMGSKQYSKPTLGLEQHFTFISVFCFDTEYFRKWLAIINKEKGEKYLLNHYFNFAYIAYAGLKKEKIILFKDNFILVNASNNCTRNVKWKIYTDLSDLLYMIQKKYRLTGKFKRFLIRIRFFFVTLAIGAFIHKLGLTNNKYYISFRKFVSKLKI